MAFLVNREKLAWAAGLFEGEGCFNIHKHSRGGSAVLWMSDRDVVEEFIKVIGFGKLALQKKKKKETNKQMYGVRLYKFEHVQALAAMLWPWLKQRRKGRIKELLLSIKQPTKVWMSAEKRHAIVTRFRQGASYRELADEFSVSTNRAWYVANGLKRGEHKWQASA